MPRKAKVGNVVTFRYTPYWNMEIGDIGVVAQLGAGKIFPYRIQIRGNYYNFMAKEFEVIGEL